MASIVQDIQAVHSLRKDLRDVKLPSNILNSIETIHNCIKSGTDLNGWKKVDWRNNGAAGGAGGAGGAGAAGGGSRNSYSNQRPNHKNNNFFSERNSNEKYEQSGHHAFGNRNKAVRQQNESHTSIPLTNSSTHTVTEQNDGFKPVTQRYVSKFKKNSEKVEDTILNTILLGKLNKFSELNYDEIKEFITHIIDSGQNEMIKCFMKLVFEKAASEEVFCPLYAKLLSELSSRYPILLTEMNNLYSVYMQIFEEVSETKAENYNEVCKQNVEKKYRRGYSQFLAELIKHNVIDNELFTKTINKIINQIKNNIKNKESTKLVEEYADCLMKIMKAIQKDTSISYDSDSESENMIETIRNTLKNDTMIYIQVLTVRKARFTFLDIYEGIQKF
jgi:hypothetical protein